ncbi:MAG: DoxX family protein [Myxococcota bacterium]
MLRALTLSRSLVLLRVMVAVVFLAHATVRVVNGTIPRFAGFLEDKGLPFGLAQVYAITAFELLGGLALAVGVFRRVLSAGFFVMLTLGNVLIHFERGWFVGEHGDGGMEYSVVLQVCLLVLFADARPAADAGVRSARRS